MKIATTIVMWAIGFIIGWKTNTDFVMGYCIGLFTTVVYTLIMVHYE